MTTITGRLETAKASRYVQRLCGHLAQKAEATRDEAQGTAALPMARLRLRAGPETLSAEVEGDRPAALDRGRGILDSPLWRTAFRKRVGVIAWTGAGGTPLPRLLPATAP